MNSPQSLPSDSIGGSHSQKNLSCNDTFASGETFQNVSQSNPKVKKDISLNLTLPPASPRDTDMIGLIHTAKQISSSSSLGSKRVNFDKKIKDQLNNSYRTKEENPSDIKSNSSRPNLIGLESAYFTPDVEAGMPSWRMSTKNSTFTRRGGTFNWGVRLWISYFAFILIAILIQLSFGFGDWAFPDSGLSCSKESGKLRNILMCDLSKNLIEVVQQLRFLSAFILGGFVISSVQLWLTRRRDYTMMCGAVRNLLINLCAIIPGEHDRQLVSRWVVLGYELTVLKGRGLDDTDEGREYLDKLNLIQSDEWISMGNGNRHTTVWYWIQMKVTKLSHNETINRHECATISAAVTLLREKANDLMSPIARDQPPPYIFLCAVLVNINLILQSISKGIEWAIWMHDTQGGVWKEPRMYIQVLGLFLFLTIYAMLFDVCGLLYNPFGPRIIDIDHYVVGKGIRKLAQQLAKGALPQTMNCATQEHDDWDVTDLYKKEDLRISTKVGDMRQSSIGIMRRSLRSA